ncbi:MAG TPA: hypothetical protein VHV51_02405 [Polyangiaceae bacterium]|nr:hypothetical protein [Polyangiaceae bacterium]
MAEKKAGFASPPRAATPHTDTIVDQEDMTVLFAPPRELLEQSAGRDESELTVVQRRADWESEDEATIAARPAFITAEPKSEPVTVRPGAAPTFALPVAPLSHAPQQAAVFSSELADDEMGAILGPRRKARRLAIGLALALVLILVVVARFAP